MKHYIKSNKSYSNFAIYTIIFCLVIIFIYFPFIHQQHSFVWEIDGSKQHYPALAYLGIYIRETISNFLHTGHLSLKMWDMTLGYGGDILTTLNYYSFGDPLDLLSILVPYRYTEYLYSFLVIFRIYLSGLSFSYYCKTHGHEGMHVLIGSIMYSFCGYTIIFATRHPFFINPMIYLPLLLVGIDQMLENKKSVLFHIMVIISLISNFYFFYMLTLFMFLYALLRFFELHPKDQRDFRLFFKSFFHCTIQFILGILNSAVIFLPVLISFFNTERLDQPLPDNLFLYHPDYYKSLIPSLFFSTLRNTSQYINTSYLGYSALAIISFVLLFKIRKKFLTFKVVGLTLFIFLLFPFAGFALNGFSYISNRWTFLLSFVLSYCFVLVFESFIAHTNFSVYAKLAILVFVIVEVSIKGFYNNSPLGDNQVSVYYDLGTANNRLTDNSINSLHKRELTSGFRVDVLDRESRNYGILNRLPTVSSYFSITSKYSSLFSRYLGNAGETVTVSIGNFDSRSGLNLLTGVKYVTETSTHGNHSVPFGYKKIKSKSRTLYNGEKTIDTIHKNTNYIGLFSVYDNSISENNFLEYSTYQREQVMLQSCILEKQNKKTNKDVSIDTQVSQNKNDFFKQIKTYISKNPKCGIKVDKNNKIYVSKENCTFTFRTKGAKNSEIYLYFEDSDFIPKNYSISSTNIIAFSSNGKSIYECKAKNSSTLGIDTALLNTGYSKSDSVKISVIFTNPGAYSFKDVKVIHQPTHKYSHYVNKLKERKISNLQIDNNNISAEICVEKNKLLNVAVPYSPGWSCMIDGKETKITRSNIMFMSVPLTKGSHTVIFTYRTPGLKTGLCISLVTSLYCLYFFRRKHL